MQLVLSPLWFNLLIGPVSGAICATQAMPESPWRTAASAAVCVIEVLMLGVWAWGLRGVQYGLVAWFRAFRALGVRHLVVILLTLAVMLTAWWAAIFPLQGSLWAVAVGAGAAVIVDLGAVTASSRRLDRRFEA
jgi:hypothetical protein